MQMDLRETLLDAAEHALEPVDLQIRMQPALHEHARAAHFHGLANLFVNGVEIQDVAFWAQLPFSGR